MSFSRRSGTAEAVPSHDPIHEGVVVKVLAWARPQFSSDDFKNSFLCRTGVRGQRICVAPGRPGDGPGLRPYLRPPLPKAVGCDIEKPAASLGCRPGLRHEPARRDPRRTQRIRLHLVQHRFAMVVGMPWARCSGCRRTPAYLISTGTAICGGSAIAASARSPAPATKRWRSRWERFCAQFRGPADVPGRRRRPEAHPDTIRPVGRAGHSRYEFGRRSGREIRGDGTCSRDDRKTGARPVDRSPRAWRSVDRTCPGKNAVAMVHRPCSAWLPSATPTCPPERRRTSLSRTPRKSELTAALYLIGSGVSVAALKKVDIAPCFWGESLSLSIFDRFPLGSSG